MNKQIYKFMVLLFFSCLMAGSSSGLKSVNANVDIGNESETIFRFQNAVSSILGQYVEYENYGVDYLDKSDGFHIVFGFAREDAKTDQIKSLLATMMPKGLMQYKEVKYSVSDLQVALNEIFKNQKEYFKDTTDLVAIGVNEKTDKVQLDVKAIEVESKNDIIAKYGDIIEFNVDKSLTNPVPNNGVRGIS